MNGCNFTIWPRRLVFAALLGIAAPLSAADPPTPASSAGALIFPANYGTGTTWSVGDVAKDAPKAKVATAPAKAAPAKKSDGVSEADKLQFTQQDAQAQMRELQDRMFHLADITREFEPDNSTRLLLAVRKAREQLIIEQMTEVLGELSTKDLSKATTETKEILVKLADLKNLLIAADLEMQLQLERLRGLQSAIRGLDRAIDEQKRQESQSSAVVGLMKKQDKKKPQGLEKGSLDKAQQEQAANRKQTQSIADKVKSLGNLEKAVGSLGESSQSMSKAEKSLMRLEPRDAWEQQTAARKKLESARDELAKEREQVLADLERQVRRVVIENLQEMLSRQGAVRQQTQSLAPRAEKEREAVMRLRQLAPPEQRIAAFCGQTLDLVNETEFSVALPPALEALQKNMLYVAGDLAGGRADPRVIETELGIEQDLKDLLETFKELPDTNPSQNNSQCNGCKGNMNKLLAELKVVRLLQSRVNQGTLDADADAHRARAAADLPPELRDKIGKVRDGEQSARDTMRRLHERYVE